jgi:hypothetical protein
MLSRHNDDIKSSSEEISSKYLELMERFLLIRMQQYST